MVIDTVASDDGTVKLDFIVKVAKSQKMKAFSILFNLYKKQQNSYQKLCNKIIKQLKYADLNPPFFLEDGTKLKIPSEIWPPKERYNQKLNKK